MSMEFAKRTPSRNNLNHRYVPSTRTPHVGTCVVGTYGTFLYERTIFQVTYTLRDNPVEVNIFTVIASSSNSAVTQVDFWILANMGESFPTPSLKDYQINVVALTPAFKTTSCGVIGFSYVW